MRLNSLTMNSLTMNSFDSKKVQGDKSIANENKNKTFTKIILERTVSIRFRGYRWVYDGMVHIKNVWLMQKNGSKRNRFSLTFGKS